MTANPGEIVVRPLLVDRPDPDEAFSLISDVDLQAFQEEPSAEHYKVEKALVECNRAFLAWDGGDPVGCAAIYSMEFSVPGGEVPTAGVTWVGVRPTHRRRGIMRKLLDQTHAEISERGLEPIAALWASQPPIYGRFGYGLAAPSLSVVIPRAHGSLSRAPHDPDLSLRLVEPAADLTVANSVYEAVRSRRPGMSRVDERWHAANVSDAKEDREGKSALATVVVEGTDGVEAYARYALKHNWSAGYADGLIDVRTLVAATATAEAALWRYLIDYELSGSVDAWNLPSDSPIRWWLDQPRHAKRQLHDSLYVRLIDVGQALSARTYTRPIDVVLDVTDQYCPWNTGRWRLSGDQSGATCEQTPDAADLSMDVATLGAAYLGGTSLTDLAGAAWVEELRSGSLAECSHAFSNQPAPWSPFVF